MTNYIGQAPVFGDFPFQVFYGTGTSTYTLEYKVPSENGLLVFLNGAVQRPGIDYTASGNTLVFSDVVPTGVQIFTYGMGLPKSQLSPSAGSVGTSELSAGIYASDEEAQDWSNALKLLNPKGLNSAFKGANQSLSANGYQKLPGGLIIQWGTTGAGVTANVTLPIAFPSANVAVTANSSSADGFCIAHVYSLSTTGFTIEAEASTTGGPYKWIAIGY